MELDNLTDREKRDLLKLIDLKVQNELLWNFIKENPLPFCLPNIKNPPFEINNHTTNLLVNLIQLINDGKLVLKDA